MPENRLKKIKVESQNNIGKSAFHKSKISIQDNKAWDSILASAKEQSSRASSTAKTPRRNI